MYLGHIGIGLAARPAAPEASLGVLLFAATALDFICGVFMLIGVEGLKAGGPGSFPWSHGFIMSLAWTALAFAIAFLASRNLRTSLTTGLLVESHWILDFISHPMGFGKAASPDLPILFEGSLKVGLGLYNSIAAAIVTEFGFLALGIVVYLRTTKARNRMGAAAFWLMIAFLFTLPLVSFLPPRLSFMGSLSGVVLIPFGIWIDRHRDPVTKGKR